MKILIFTEGTIIMHKNGAGHKREEIVKQVIEGDESVRDFASYIPVGNAVEKLKRWKGQGAEILYLTSRKEEKEVNDIKNVLKKFGFPGGQLHFAESVEYKDVVERIEPDILIEDDCESIGKEEIICPTLNPELKTKTIIIREFGGIDHLPNILEDLIK
ncbi:MAG: hypothetical protein JSV92_00185 [archaeon]|nr:MAG: hypothetical protein JSV92_00185 [archaeon]